MQKTTMLACVLLLCASCGSLKRQIPEHQRATIVLHVSPDLAGNDGAREFYSRVYGNLSSSEKLQVINGDDDQKADPLYPPISVTISRPAATMGHSMPVGGTGRPGSPQSGANPATSLKRTDDVGKAHGLRLDVLSTFDPNVRMEFESLGELRYYLRLE